MQDAGRVRRRKRQSNATVLAGVGLMVLALVASGHGLAPAWVTTTAAFLGFLLVMYGVHVGWLVFYEREPDGPAS